MVKEAEQHAEEDRRQREEAETKNKGEQFAYSVERFMSESAEKLPSADKIDIETKLGALREALKDGDTGRIESTQRDLEAAFNQAAQAVYQQAGEQEAAAQPGADGSASATESPDDVVEAEFHSTEEGS
jgi:molecular chaperone DnaK